MKSLYEELIKYSHLDYYPFHMPGHKRNINQNISKKGLPLAKYSPYEYDITEIDGFDNLHAPEGIIKSGMERASEMYASSKSYFLVNGSTCGILAAISAACLGNELKRGIIMARNSHRSAYNGAFVNGLDIKYIYPDVVEGYGISGGIDPKKLELLLEGEERAGNIKNIGAVYITSPTYEGVTSDIEKIAFVCHKYMLPLIVDEAHGAHFSMFEAFPISALRQGADIVIQSLHKTLPALTQTAIIHVGRESFFDCSILERYLAVYQTSSPSYVLMASIDQCIDMLCGNRALLFREFAAELNNFRDRASELENIRLAGKEIKGKSSVKDIDLSKLVMFSCNRSFGGRNIYDRLLKDFHIQVEMASVNYIIAMTSIMDNREGFDRLYEALKNIDSEISHNIAYFEEAKEEEKACESGVSFVLKTEIKISEAIAALKEQVPLEEACGRISSEFVYLYPPGIPIIVPGEMYDKSIIEYIRECQARGIKVMGLKGEAGQAQVTAK